MADDIIGKVAEAATVQNVTDQAVGLFALGENLINRLSSKWSLYQIGIIIGLIVLSYFVKLVLKPKIRAALGNLHGVPKPLLRILVLLNQRIALILFVLFSWIAYFIMQTATWPSRSYFIGIVASLATAWVIIAVLTKLINNRTIRKFVAWGAWTYATLQILNLWDKTANLLETIAIDTGGIRISVMMVLTAIITLGVLFALANVLNRSGARQIHNAQDMSPSIKALLTKALQLLLYGGALLFSLRAVGFDLGSLALLSGAIGLGIGFGLQKIVSNLISGIIILLDKSIKPGDVISLDGTFGWITQLGARYASITTRDGREYLVPNEDFITNQVINWTHSSDFVRLDIHFGVSYDSDPHFVKKIASEAPLSVNRVVSSPAPVCHIINFGDSSIDFKLRFWIKDPTSGLTNIRGNVYLALWDTLKEHDIEIPYPRRDVHMYTEQSQRPEPTKLPED
ncbi:mechanosensitive ion channel protein [Amylibacter ulvae]|uniref:Mechanosensitive ion channel protein n=1 Tax=Paramylibacter ulvae TaxID=1651968 RepID=A0ABQ3CWZ0_9RHOB|nr:mechanosensitive ion channel domain-containing protein [Amylibacter ulvae]GHA47427.1 mechanosensitive ion channel protein [Amylibacter ulvae]